MVAPILSFKKVSKKFGKTTILHAVDFEVSPGQQFGLAGENGAGKTTLLKCLLDFCAFDGGTIEIKGVPSTRPQARACMTFLPERFTPPWYLTGREFVQATMQISGTAWNEQAVLTIFEELDLARASLDKPVRTFSKGMTQKLGLAACFLSGKDLFVLDEPMSGLDPSARVRVKRLLQRLKNEGKSLIFTSHSLADIDEICDHMVVLHRGSVAYSGSPGQMLLLQGEQSLERAFLKCIEANSHGR
ncbi:MAG: ABC transporter ATP-binding protein [Burkholderiales bacterium]